MTTDKTKNISKICETLLNFERKRCPSHLNNNTFTKNNRYSMVLFKSLGSDATSLLEVHRKLTEIR